MDNRERLDDPEETLRVALDGFRSGLWTALPGIVQSFNAAAITAVVQPAIMGIVRRPIAGAEAVPLPLLQDVPVIFPRGGNCTLTFPVAAGDECLLVVSSRCIDAWWQQGGVQVPMESRMHDLSDAFAYVGPFSQKHTITGISTSTVQLRSNDGLTYVELNAAGHVVNIVAPGGLNINAPTVAITGTITATVDVMAAGKSLKTHLHGGVASGGSDTTGPI